MYMVISVNRHRPGTGTVHALVSDERHSVDVCNRYSLAFGPDDVFFGITPYAVIEATTDEGGSVLATVLVNIYSDKRPSPLVAVVVPVPAYVWESFQYV